MPSRVLVAYGTTNGSTAEIAEAVAKVLRKDGLTVDVLPAGSVASAASYEAVVVGGALYAGRRHKDARRFVRRHRRALAGRPLWLFRSGPHGAEAVGRDIPPVPGVKKAMTGRPRARHLRRLSGGGREGMGGRDDPALREGRGLPGLHRHRGVGGAGGRRTAPTVGR